VLAVRRRDIIGRPRRRPPPGSVPLRGATTRPHPVLQRTVLHLEVFHCEAPPHVLIPYYNAPCSTWKCSTARRRHTSTSRTTTHRAPPGSVPLRGATTRPHPVLQRTVLVQVTAASRAGVVQESHRGLGHGSQGRLHIACTAYARDDQI